MTAATQIIEILHASIWGEKKRALIFMLNKLWSLSHTLTHSGYKTWIILVFMLKSLVKFTSEAGTTVQAL